MEINVGSYYGDYKILRKNSEKKNYFDMICENGHSKTSRKDHIHDKLKCPICSSKNNHIGDVHNGLTLISFDHYDNNKNNRYYKVKCFCGNIFVSSYSSITTGHTKSCGCIKNIHGDLNKDDRFRNWEAMVSRTTNINHSSYNHYHEIIHGKIIEDDWIKSPQLFFNEIGVKPGKDYTIDRIDNSKGYLYGNVKWSNKRDQQLNRTTKRGITNHKYIYFDKRKNKFAVYLYTKLNKNSQARKFMGYTETIEDGLALQEKILSLHPELKPINFQIGTKI